MSRTSRSFLRLAALSLALAGCPAPDELAGPDAGDAVEPAPDKLGPNQARVLFPWGERVVTYEVIDDLAVMEGDMGIGPVAQIESLAKANLVTDVSRRWPDAISYAFDTTIPVGDSRRTAVADGVADFEAKTPLRFQLIANPCSAEVYSDCETDYILVADYDKKGGLSSHIGMAGGQQMVFLHEDSTKSTVLHEFGHAVGMYHESNRADRDNHVEPNPDCMKPGGEDQFIPNGPDESFGPYDFKSIWHYRSNSQITEDQAAPPCNGGWTLLRKPGAAPCPEPFCSDEDGDGFAERIKWRSDLSDGDINALWAMYGAEQGVPETGDNFAQSVAIADFDNDGYVDVAVGAHREAVISNSVDDAGALFTFKGGPEGFQPWWIYTQEDLGGTSSPFDLFGSSMVVADFDDDGFPDLAVSSPDDQVGSVDNAGRIYILRGTESGLTAAQVISQGTIGALNEANDRFGSALAAGDFDCDGVADLAVGARGEAPPGGAAAGWVYVLRGDATAPFAMSLFDSVGQDQPIGYGPEWTIGDAMGVPAAGDGFGTSLAAARLDDQDACDDLVVGAPYDDDQISNGGGAYVFRGSAPFGMIAWTRIGDLFTNVADQTGLSLAAGDFDADGLGEIALGMPAKTVDGNALAGQVLLFHVSGNQIVTGQRFDDGETTSDLAAGDRFGTALWFEPFRRQLFVGVPWEDNGSVGDAGIAHRFAFESSTPVHEVMMRQSPNGIEQTPDRYGWSIATVRHGIATWIAIGSPGENGAEGLVMVYRSTLDGTPVHQQNLVQDSVGSESD